MLVRLADNRFWSAQALDFGQVSTRYPREFSRHGSRHGAVLGAWMPIGLNTCRGMLASEFQRPPSPHNPLKTRQKVSAWATKNVSTNKGLGEPQNKRETESPRLGIRTSCIWADVGAIPNYLLVGCNTVI